MSKSYLLPIVAAVGLLLCLSAIARCEEADDAFAAAHGHYQRGEWSQAADALTAFLENHPQHGQAAAAMFYLGEALVQQNQYDAGRDWFLKFLQQAPEHALARQATFRVGEASYLAGKFADAWRELDGFRDEYPDDALNEFALPYLGEIAAATNNSKLAKARFIEALEKYPDGPLSDDCRLGLGRACEQLGETEAALTAYRVLADSQSPLADDARLQIGILLYNRGRFADAERAFAQFLDATEESELRLPAAYWLGMSQFALRRWTDAAASLQQAADMDADSEHTLAPVVQFWLAESRRRNGEQDAALAAYRRVANDWPKSDWADDALLALIQAALDRGDFAELELLAKAFDKQQEKSPLQSQVRQLRGRALLKQEKFAEAVRWFGGAAEGTDATDGTDGADAKVSRELQETDRYYLALALLGDKQYPTALETLTQIRLPEGQRELQDCVQVARALALIHLDRHTEAVAPLQRYLVSQPNGTEAAQCRVHLVLALVRTDRLREAQELHARLPESDARHPLFVEATLYLADALAGKKQFTAARPLYAEAAQLATAPELQARAIAGTGWSDWHSGKTPAAIDSFALLLEKHPTDPRSLDAALTLGKAQEKLGNPRAALQAYLWITANWKTAAAAPPAYLAAARLLEQHGHKPQAAGILERLLTEFPQLEQRDATVYQLAWLLAETGRDEESDRWFASLAAAEPPGKYWADATYRLAERAADGQQPDRAKELAERLIDAKCEQPVLAHAIYLRGQLAAAAGQWEEVQTWMQRLPEVTAAGELRLPAEYWLAEAAYQREQFDDALARFEKLGRAAQGRGDDWLAMIPLRQAQMLAQRGRYDDAQRLAAGIARQFPQFAQQYEADYVLGRCFAAKSQFTEARQAYQAVIESASSRGTETAAMAQWMIGDTYFQQQQYAEAIRAFHHVNALHRFPRWQAGALMQAAQCHELLDQPRQAVQMYQQLQTEHPGTPYAAEATKRLNDLAAAVPTARPLDATAVEPPPTAEQESPVVKQESPVAESVPETAARPRLGIFGPNSSSSPRVNRGTPTPAAPGATASAPNAGGEAAVPNATPNAAGVGGAAATVPDPKTVPQMPTSVLKTRGDAANPKVAPSRATVLPPIPPAPVLPTPPDEAAGVESTERSVPGTPYSVPRAQFIKPEQPTALQETGLETDTAENAPQDPPPTDEPSETTIR